MENKDTKEKNHKIFNNIGLKLLAIICSFSIWFVVMNVQDGIITKTIRDIPVDMINGDSITKSGNLYNITNGETVSVIVKGPRSTVENLDVDNFTAVADLSQLSVANSTTIEVELNSSVNATKAKKVTITPINQYVSLSVEQEVEKSVPVKVITTGSVAEGYAAGNATPTPNMVTIQGPDSVLSNIVEARAVVDITGATEDIESTVSVGCIDGYGSAVQKDNITLSSAEATVTIPVYKTKEVPINVNTAGVVLDGYGIRAVNYEPSSIMVAGDPDALDTLESIDINDIVVTGSSDNIEKNIEISGYLPSGLFVADESAKEIAVNVEIVKMSEVEKSLAIKDIKINDQNNGGGLKYEIESPSALTIKITGFEEDLKNVDVSSLNPRISVKDLKEGEYDLEVSFDASDIYNIKDTYSVKVKVSKTE